MASVRTPSLLAREIGKTGPFASAEEEVYLNLLRTASVLSREIEAFFGEHGLSEPLYNALRIAGGHGANGVPTLTIGKHLVAQVPDVTRLVDRLEKVGLVTRDRCEKDRRVVFVKITPAGTAKLAEMNPRASTLLKKLLGHLGKARLGELTELLEDARRPHVPAEYLEPHE